VLAKLPVGLAAGEERALGQAAAQQDLAAFAAAAGVVDAAEARGLPAREAGLAGRRRRGEDGHRIALRRGGARQGQAGLGQGAPRIGREGGQVAGRPAARSAAQARMIHSCRTKPRLPPRATLAGRRPPFYSACIGTTIDETPEGAMPWQAREAENRQVAALLGMQRWKRAAIAAAFAHDGTHPPFAETPDAALALARGRGAIAAWATRLPEGFAERCAGAGVPLWQVEDGFLRSVGLGVDFAPAASLCVDAEGPHYDPARPSRLERLLGETEFPPALLARAAALRARIVAGGVTKYNLRRKPPPLPASPGRARILVPGQVEDDASVRLGAAGIRTNLALLEAVRAAHPRAFLVYRPHPDVLTGYRRGHVPRRLALRLADHVSEGGDIHASFAQVDAVHVLTSLAGFEALLRGLPVTCWGRPFFSGWGLSQDMHPPPRRGRPLPLDALVAAALILYPRYTDPVTRRPCEVERVLERLEQPRDWPALPPGRRLYLHWWRQQGRALRLFRRLGLWRR
jgi:capsular polysaccharide export protein